MKKNALIKKYAPKGLSVSPKTIRKLVEKSFDQSAEDENAKKMAKEIDEMIEEVCPSHKVDWKNANILKHKKPGPCSSGLTPLKELIGSTITGIGMVDAEKLPGKPYIEGGLIIDYDRPLGVCISRGVLSQSRRIVLGFTELGIWVEWQGDR